MNIHFLLAYSETLRIIDFKEISRVEHKCMNINPRTLQLSRYIATMSKLRFFDTDTSTTEDNLGETYYALTVESIYEQQAHSLVQ